jgi:glutamate-1-semialdehyde 2,1-aminomutase
MAAAGREKIGHPGTFNANPVSAAAGIAALTILAETDACDVASARAAELRAGVNEVLEEERVPWALYGTFSGFHLFMNTHDRDIRPSAFDAAACSMEELKTQPAHLAGRLRLALLVQGIDGNGRLGGFLSATHTDADVAETVAGWREAIHMLRTENELS